MAGGLTQSSAGLRLVLSAEFHLSQGLDQDWTRTGDVKFFIVFVIVY
jgi:hypothetical protein